MRRYIAATAAVVCLLVFAAAAAAATTYGPLHWWSPGENYRSSYSNWTVANYFGTYIGADTTVTFIDNVTYNWHNTRRQSSQMNRTIYDPGPPYDRYAHAAFCKYHSPYTTTGSCFVD